MNPLSAIVGFICCVSIGATLGYVWGRAVGSAQTETELTRTKAAVRLLMAGHNAALKLKASYHRREIEPRYEYDELIRAANEHFW